MVNADLVAAVTKHLAVSGKVFLQTDIEFLADEMFEIFRQNEFYKEIDIEENPFPVKTERENAVEEKDLPVYRKVFIKAK